MNPHKMSNRQIKTHKNDECIESRRRVLRQLGGLSAFGVLPGLSSLLTTQTALAAGSYKALVCVFLFGGNDANNMVVPTDASGYNTYFHSRGGVIGTASNGALALPNAGSSGGVLSLSGTSFGLNPNMPELQTLWQSGNVAMLFNVGNLVQPFANPAAFLANRDPAKVPVNLYSHLDQQQQMQNTSAGAAITGWAGRIADSITVPSGGMPVGVSVDGNISLLTGTTTSPIIVPQKGTLTYNGFTSAAASQARLAALKTMFSASGDSLLACNAGGVQSLALNTANVLQPILASAATVSGNFPKYTTSYLSQQLAQTALLIQAAANGAISAPAQQIFFVALNGFDTHNNELAVQGPLLADLSSSLNGFYNALIQIGQASNVVTFTLSDFARTLKPASGGGSDHAWGSHHLVMGSTANVRAGTYGTFPDLTLGGTSDVSTEGRWMPTTSIDQYGATLATWLGASASAINSAFPNLANFSTRNLGFLA